MRVLTRLLAVMFALGVMVFLLLVAVIVLYLLHVDIRIT